MIPGVGAGQRATRRGCGGFQPGRYAWPVHERGGGAGLGLHNGNEKQMLLLPPALQLRGLAPGGAAAASQRRPKTRSPTPGSERLREPRVGRGPGTRGRPRRGSPAGFAAAAAMKGEGGTAPKRRLLPLLFHLYCLLRGAPALRPRDLFPYGEARGDQFLLEGDDETSASVKLKRPLRFYEAPFRSLYVGTNGIISTQDFPSEIQYVDNDFPTEFPVIAPFLSDLDTSNGRGKISYREDDSLEILNQAAQYIRIGFPKTAANYTPTHAFLATWKDVCVYEKVTQNVLPSRLMNTFQLVLAFDEFDTYALFLYPTNGLQFFGSHPKESYDMQLELPARVGFSRGKFNYQKREGLYFHVASTEQSVKNLFRISNLGIPGVWAFHIGSTFQLENIEPAYFRGNLSIAHSLEHFLTNVSESSVLKSNYTEDELDYVEDFYNENIDESKYLSSGQELVSNNHNKTEVLLDLNASSHSQVDQTESNQSGISSPMNSELKFKLLYTAPSPKTESDSLDHQIEERTPESEAIFMISQDYFESSQQKGINNSAPPDIKGEFLDLLTEASPFSLTNETIQTFPDDGTMSSEMEILSAYSEEVVLTDYPFPENPPPLKHGKFVMGMEEESNFNSEVFTYEAASKESCEQKHRQCSQHAFCTDYSTGFCCHCQSKYYGNGKHCLLEGAPHRINGKVSGHLHVGHTPVSFSEVDLHAYIVGNDGRVYIAISHIPHPAAQALLPLTPIGGFFGWLFALEKPGYENGFSITGAAFSNHMDITFYPGEERVHITHIAEGLDPENHLSVMTNIQGQVPFIPANFSAHIAPYKEIYHYSDLAVTSTTSREYYLSFGEINQTFTYHLQQNITYQNCKHTPNPRIIPRTQQLNMDRIFALYNEEEKVLRYAMTNQIGPMEGDIDPMETNPCYDGSHACDIKARCLVGTGLTYSCECSTGYQGDGRNCFDINECATDSNLCDHNAMCINLPGSYTCECQSGYEFAEDKHTCILIAPPSNPCEEGSHNCAPMERAQCIYHGGTSYSCICLSGYVGNGHECTDVDECIEERCHPDAACHNIPGSFSCRCQPGFKGDGFQCFPESTQTPETVCERWRKSLLDYYGGIPREDQYVPQCDESGHFNPLQCHGNSNYCWCVDKDGREIEGTRSHPGIIPACIPSIAPPTILPSPQPDVLLPSVGTFLLYAQGQKIGYLPLNGTRLQKETAKTLLSLHGSIVVGIDYDCQEKMVYWTDVAGRVISRINLELGNEPEIVISSGLMSPEGLAIDYLHRTMFWTDSGLDKIESANLDGSKRKVLFDSDLVNPRAITVDPIRGNLYWTDWNREGPKIETSSVDGTNRRILVNKDIGLPNGLTFDPFSKLICWADAGTKKLECALSNGTGRHIIQNNLNYPFSIVSYANHFYHTDWRRDGVIAINKDNGQFTDEYLPEQRSHLYGITAIYPNCPKGMK
ncbi:nidogen-2 [Macrotis lagotis]|uniref:nidogen-2 n=1 Tax=Macrotis lagotis TaxID=92651 RepID=UPI003D696416